jgi:hypothetical protein
MRASRGSGRRAVIGTAVALALLGMPGASQAQSGNQTQWGLRATFTPSWEIPTRVMEIDFLQDYIGEGSEVSGAELAVGFVRGSRFGGDWGFGYVRKSLSDSTRIDINNGETCISAGSATQCGVNREVYTTKGVAFQGLELHKFVPWFTIKRRAQIGMNLAIGAMMVSGGSVTKTSTITTAGFDTVARQQTLATVQNTTDFDGKGFLDDLGVPSILPIAKLEFAVTGILARNLKVRASAGMNLPGVQRFSVTAVYLFGS